MAAIANIFTAFGLSASAGLNAYIPLLTVAIFQALGWIGLNEPFNALGEWWAILVIVILGAVEFFADKIPAVDTINDGINTFVRPAAGALLFAATANMVTEINPILSVIAGLLVAGTVHTGKTLARPVVTATTAGVGNPIVSTIEDVVSVVTSLVALVLPWLVLLIVTIGIVLFLVWRLKRLDRKDQARA